MIFGGETPERQSSGGEGDINCTTQNPKALCSERTEQNSQIDYDRHTMTKIVAKIRHSGTTGIPLSTDALKQYRQGRAPCG